MLKLLNEGLTHWGIPKAYVGWVVQVGIILLIIILSILADWIARKLLVTGMRLLVAKSKNRWDDALVEAGMFNRLSHLVPAIIIYSATGLMFPQSELLQRLIEHVSLAYMILIAGLVVSAFLTAVTEISQQIPATKDKPIKSIVQAIKVVLFLIVGVLILATLLDRSPWVFLSGIGAMTAVTLIVFKDSIMGLVASIQLAALDMVRQGDWIEMPKFGADGDVIDVSLTTIKVRNWDKTITTIPTYALISDSFKNWRGMSESGGRRIKRSINIDMTSVKFCSDKMIQNYKKMECLKEYIETKEKELSEYNQKHGIDPSQILNGRRMTNLGTFRAYIQEYLHRHPKIHQNMTFLIRHLQPTASGLPIEIYVFSNDQRWANYESIQADIFDHILAAIPEFDLRVFQNPSGGDFQHLTQAKKA